MDELIQTPKVERGEQFALGTVGIYATSVGTTITFDGESSAGLKRYKRVNTYTPASGDRVLLAKVSGTYVILGKVVL